MIPIEDNYTLLSLLPYAPNAELLSKHQKIDDLYFIKSVIDFSLTALEAFLLGHLAHFDAQVGENLCQIRAYKVIQLAKKMAFNIKRACQSSRYPSWSASL